MTQTNLNSERWQLGKLKTCWTLIILRVHQLAIVKSKVNYLPPYLNLPQQLCLENSRLNILLKVIWLTWVRREKLERHEDVWLMGARSVLVVGKWRSARLPEYRKVSISLLRTQLTSTSSTVSFCSIRPRAGCDSDLWPGGRNSGQSKCVQWPATNSAIQVGWFWKIFTFNIVQPTY